VTDDAVAEVARAAAWELMQRYGPRLVTDTEAAIHADGDQYAHGQEPPAQYLDPVALGALIVSITQFGHQVYTDRKSKGQQPTREQVAQVIRIERRKHSDVTGDEAEVIDIISAKIIEYGHDKLPGWPSRPPRPRLVAASRSRAGLIACRLQYSVIVPDLRR
jgi:hypothetical protein